MPTELEFSQRAVAHCRNQLNTGRDEARRWLELLSNRQLAENIARTRDELAKVRDADLSEPLAQVLADLGIQPESLTSEDREALLCALADVQDRQDLAYAEELLERRRREGIDSIVGEVVAEGRRRSLR